MTIGLGAASLTVFAAILTIAGASLAADPGPPPASKQACFYSRDIYNFVAVDDRTVNIRVGVKDVYRLDLFNDCTGVQWAEHIELISRPGSFICTGAANDVDLFIHTTVGPLRCPVSNIHKLTPDEIGALSRKQKP
jgi:hypothetical protein